MMWPPASRRATALPQPRWAALAFLCLLLPGRAQALRTVAPAELRADLGRVHTTLAACGAAAPGCDASALPADEQVSDSRVPGGSYTAHWIEARGALQAAAKENDAAKRRDLLRPAEAEAAALEADLDAQPQPLQTFAQARRIAGAVLAGDEFQRAHEPTWYDRLEARLFNWWNNLFEGVGRLSAHAPWLPLALEWLCFAGAVAGLLVLAQRTLARQRLKVALSGGAIRAREWELAPAAWARDAERRAAAGEWREAIHCLYWASIVLLEDRRAWRHNPARTPREYVRLLAAGSESRQRLGSLTGLFERVWYGLREASEPDYRAARDSFEGLQIAPVEAK